MELVVKVKHFLKKNRGAILPKPLAIKVLCEHFFLDFYSESAILILSSFDNQFISQWVQFKLQFEG